MCSCRYVIMCRKTTDLRLVLSPSTKYKCSILKMKLVIIGNSKLTYVLKQSFLLNTLCAWTYFIQLSRLARTLTISPFTLDFSVSKYLNTGITIILSLSKLNGFFYVALYFRLETYFSIYLLWMNSINPYAFGSFP